MTIVVAVGANLGDVYGDTQVAGSRVPCPAFCQYPANALHYNAACTMPGALDPGRIAQLLQPFLAGSPGLSASQLDQISTYINILLHWNSRINLTAVRRPEEIVTRHFGESLFAATHLFPAQAEPSHPSPAKGVGTGDTPVPPFAEQSSQLTSPNLPLPAPTAPRVFDVGSGAGFPGLPLKIWAPRIHLTLLESSHKKATFLREVSRALALTDVDVFCGRAQDFPRQADLVTLRAVERFHAILPVAAKLVAAGGRLALLIGQSQVKEAEHLLASLAWDRPLALPGSSNRQLLIGSKL